MSLQREPATRSTPVLWDFPFSHYAEKARWALDAKRIAYRRLGFAPGLHYPRVWWRTGQPSLPVLIVNGTAVAGSARIIEVLEGFAPDPPLFPSDPDQRRKALELESDFDAHLGHDVRRFIMHHAFSAPDAARVLERAAEAFFHAASPGVRRAMSRSTAGMKALLRWRYAINADTAELSRRRIVASLDRIDSGLGREGYLAGERFSVADLCAASLLSPLVRPKEFPFPIPQAPVEEVDRFIESMRRRDAYAWVVETYRRHRGVSAEVAA